MSCIMCCIKRDLRWRHLTRPLTVL